LSPRGDFETTSNHFADTSKDGLMNNERRKFIRYPIKPYTIFLYSNYSPVKGWVKDICKEGMAFEYISNGECEPNPEIRLILTGDAFPFYLSDLFCKTIYAVEVNKNVGPFKGTGTLRCGVKYEKFDPEMQEKLTFLLNSKQILQEI